MGREVLSFDEERIRDVVMILRAGLVATINRVDKEFHTLLWEWCNEMEEYNNSKSNENKGDII